MDEDGLPLAGATLSVMSYDGPGDYDRPSNRTGLWPDDETFTADYRRTVRGHGPQAGRPVLHRSSASRPDRIPVSTPGRVFRSIVPERLGEVRDVGEVKVKVGAE